MKYNLNHKITFSENLMHLIFSEIFYDLLCKKLRVTRLKQETLGVVTATIIYSTQEC